MSDAQPLSANIPVPMERHPSTLRLLSYFAYSHLPTELQAVSYGCCELAYSMVEKLPDGPELTVGLRQLLMAKDTFVRAALDAGKQ